MNDIVSESDVQLTPWWEPVSLKTGQCWHYCVGPLSIYLQRSSNQWLLAWEHLDDTLEHHTVISEPLNEMPESLIPTRYVFSKSPANFRLKPRLLDRPVVVKTNQPVIVPQGESITFYISSPVSICVELSTPLTELREIPAVRLSDTWFGPSTRVGELCYATKTQARNNKADVPKRPHRAVTPVTVHNQSEEQLTIEKLSIPVLHLAVYGQPDGNLWTNPVSLRHTPGNPLAVLDVGKGPAGTHALAEAREPLQRSGLVRAFTSIFSD